MWPWSYWSPYYWASSYWSGFGASAVTGSGGASLPPAGSASVVSYAGVLLLHATAEMAAWVELNIPTACIWEFAERHWPGVGLSHLDGDPVLAPRPIRPGRLWWPTGASRFARAHFLADAGMVDAIRRAAYQGGYTAQPLVMQSQAGDGIATNLWLLPPRPLSQFGGAGDWHLLTLVDDRYFWWQKAANIPVTPGVTTWAQLFALLAGALGITLTVDSVPSAYQKPAGALAASYQALPLLLDAAARAVGMRLVRDLAGGCRLWSVANSQQKVRDQLATLPVKQAGGLFSLGS